MSAVVRRWAVGAISAFVILGLGPFGSPVVIGQGTPVGVSTIDPAILTLRQQASVYNDWLRIRLERILWGPGLQTQQKCRKTPSVGDAFNHPCAPP